MSYTQTLRGIASKPLDSDTLDKLATGKDSILKDAMTTPQREALKTAHKEYYDRKGVRVAPGTDAAAKRLDAAYTKASSAEALKKQKLEAAEERVKESGELKTAHAEFEAAKKVKETAKGDAAAEAQTKFTKAETALTEKKAAFSQKHSDVKVTGAGDTVIVDGAQDAKKMHEAAAAEHKVAAKRTERVAKVEHRFNRGEAKIATTDRIKDKAVIEATGQPAREVAMNEGVLADKYRKLDKAFTDVADQGKIKVAKASVATKAAEAAKDGEKAGMFAKAKANGFFKTAGENMNVFAKDAAGERRLGMKSARIAGVGAGLYVAGKGVGQLFSGNEEDSKLMAVGKIVVGLGGAGVAAVAGR